MVKNHFLSFELGHIGYHSTFGIPFTGEWTILGHDGGFHVPSL